MRKSLVAVMALAVFAAPVYADVIPSRSSSSSSDEGRVADRIATLGVDAAKAEALAKSLTDSEIEFFSAHPECLQVVGAQQDLFSGEADTFWFETATGAIVLGATGWLLYHMFTNNEPSQ